MPFFEYVCSKCHHVFTELAKYSDKVVCEKCGAPTKKQMTTPAKPQFKARRAI